MILIVNLRKREGLGIVLQGLDDLYVRRYVCI